MTKNKKKTITIIMQWEKCSADMGEFRQNSQIFMPTENTFIAVNLEITRENIHNFDVFGKWVEKSYLWELGQEDKEPEYPKEVALLTPLGASRVRDLIQEAFLPTHPYAENHEDEEEVDPDDWD